MEIEKTLAPISEHHSAPRLLVADTEPSLNNGTAVPPLPSEPCGFVAGYADGGTDLILTGCEFDSEAAAEKYLSSWSDAVVNPSPTFQGVAATTAPITSLAGWTGRTVAIPERDRFYPATRADLVRRFGTRVYVATATVEGEIQGGDVVAEAIAMATAQQEFIETNHITASTAGQGRTNEIDRISVRYLAPSWKELGTLSKQSDLAGSEEYWSSSAGASDTFEYYSREVIVSTPDAAGGSVNAAIELNTSVGDAQRYSLSLDQRSCESAPTPVPDSITAWTCSGYGGRVLAGAQNQRLRLSLDVSGELSADPRVVQRIIHDWEQRLNTLGYPMGNGEIEPATSPSRTVAPLPTDMFNPVFGDGKYILADVSDVIDDGKYYDIEAEYETPDAGFSPNVTVVASLGDVTDVHGVPITADRIGTVTSDGWATYRQISSEETDKESGTVTRTYLCYTIRLLPSGNAIEVHTVEDQEGGDLLDSTKPCFDPSDSFLPSLWDRFQTFSFEDYQPDEQQAAVRDLVEWFVMSSAFSFYGGARLVNAQVAPDSPAGTVAEWRTIWTADADAPANEPTVTAQLINFATPDDAAAFVTQAAAGAPLTPFTGVDGVEGGSNNERGIILVRRGKWVDYYVSPGRTDWSDPFFREWSIEDFANSTAKYFRATGLE